jgi:hypothetical protein
VKVVEIISENKRCRTTKIIVDKDGNVIKVSVPKPKRGFKRVELICKDKWNQFWTRHVDIKKDANINELNI